jgi:hypothetical protein
VGAETAPSPDGSLASDPQRWLWKLEDWALGMMLLGAGGVDPHAMAAAATPDAPATVSAPEQSPLGGPIYLKCEGGGWMGEGELAGVLCKGGLSMYQPLPHADIGSAWAGVGAGEGGGARIIIDLL